MHDQEICAIVQVFCPLLLSVLFVSNDNYVIYQKTWFFQKCYVAVWQTDSIKEEKGRESFAEEFCPVDWQTHNF